MTALRYRQIKNAVAMLMVSQGVPMILMGDELGRSQGGNNNTYCLDNELNWLDWRLCESHYNLFRFFQQAIAFRHAHPALRNKEHFRNQDYVGTGYADISWHGTQAWRADWSGTSRVLAFMLDGRHAKGGTVHDDFVYVAMNMHWDDLTFELPGLPLGSCWRVFANTGAAEPEDIWEPGSEPPLDNQGHFLLGGRSVAVLVGR